MDTKVNDQITNAVTQANVKVLGEAPAMAMGNLYQAMAHSTGILFQNAVSAQNQQNILAQAATTQGVMQIYSIDTAADGIADSKILNGGV
ncbi:RebB family R body protein [Chryseobacterium gambrini]|uniref:RebB family R body protein n=1 Tax=Chryseobacterium gambrini TaxID=373672 RepID=UPI0022F1B863|nr:RebB family R body protein [Chryseobacterium gambrini]WBV52261.1 RebB family R body protein [Chryseobacterium gambrini]